MTSGRGGALLLWKVYNSKLYLNKALRKSECKVSFPQHDRSELKAIKKKRNTALEDPSMTYEYLIHIIQYSAKIASSVFRDLGSRSVLFLNNLQSI